jgi:PAS domain S-box-containing protein
MLAASPLPDLEETDLRNRELKELNDKSTLALNYAEAVLNTAHQPFLVLDAKLNILRANPAFYKAFKTTPETTEGRLLYDLGDRQWDIPELREFLEALLLRDTSFKDCEITHAFPDVGLKTMRLNGTPLVGGEQLQILLAIEDVSDYRMALNTLKELNETSKSALNYARSLIEVSLDPLVTINVDGKITDVNEATIKVTGISREKLVGTDFSNYFTAPEKAQEGYRQVFAKGMVTDYPLTIRHECGRLTDVLYNASVYRDNNGAVLGVFAAARDVTAQKKAALELKELNDKSTLALNYAEAVLNTAYQPFLVLDGKLTILRANPAFYKAFETTPESTEGCLLYDLGDRQWDIPELREFLEALLLRDTSFKDCEITHAFPDVGLKTMRLNGTPLVGGEQIQILLAIEDVSDYRTALNNLKDNDLHKDEFLAMLAHELRNPLVPIRNALEIWKRGDAGKEADKKFQEIMERQLQKVVLLVDDLLDVSRITRGVIVLKKDKIDLALLISQSMEGMRSQIEERQHEASLSLPMEKTFVQGDTTRLEQVFSNLLTNAVKYTAPGGRIAVKLERQKDNALIRITDNGVGISSDLLPYIFDLFVQAERSLDRTQGGLGLGLTLVRRLAELHGGTAVRSAKKTMERLELRILAERGRSSVCVMAAFLQPHLPTVNFYIF